MGFWDQGASPCPGGLGSQSPEVLAEGLREQEEEAGARLGLVGDTGLGHRGLRLEGQLGGPGVGSQGWVHLGPRLGRGAHWSSRTDGNRRARDSGQRL